ncbi:MAG: outer membrane beta-barrel protein [Tangfeifania sp.]
MMNEDKNMDKALREKLDSFSAEPPAHLWDGIQGELAAQRRGKRMVYYSWASVAALLVLAFLAGWYFSSDTTLQPAGEVAETEITPIIEIAPEHEESTSSLQGGQQKNEEQPVESAEASRAKTTDNKIAAVAKPATDKKSETENLPGRSSLADLRFIDKIKAGIQEGTEKPEVQLKQKNGEIFWLSDSERKLIAENASYSRENRVREKGWKMGVNVAPAYSSFISEHSENYALDMAYSVSEGSGNVGAGFSVQYQTGKRWSIESGVHYAKSGQKSQNSYELFARNSSAGFGNFHSDLAYAPVKALAVGQVAMNSAAGVIALDKLPPGTEVVATPESENSFSNALLSRGEFSQVFDFIEIPLYLRYKIIDSKMDVDVLGGVNAGLVVGNNAFLDNEYGVQNIGKTEDVSALNMSGTVGVGVNYALGKHFSLAVEPRLNYYLNSINQNPEVDFRPYRIGVYTGLYYDF